MYPEKLNKSRGRAWREWSERRWSWKSNSSNQWTFTSASFHPL